MDICFKVIGKWYRPNLLVIHFAYIKSQIIIWLDRVYALKLLFYTRKEFLFNPPPKNWGCATLGILILEMHMHSKQAYI